jgi:hypothetical protein
VGRYLERWARQLVKRGWRDGVVGGSNVWLSVGAVVWLFRLMWRKPAAKVHVEELALGESLLVSHVPAPPRTRRDRRKAARREVKRAARQAKVEASRRYARAQAKVAAAETAEQAKLERKAARKHRCCRSARSKSTKVVGGSGGDVEAVS